MNAPTPAATGIAALALETLRDCRTANANLGYRAVGAGKFQEALDDIIRAIENGNMSAKQMRKLICDFEGILSTLERMDEEGITL